MKNSMKPQMAMKSTKVVVKPAAKMAMKKTMMAKPAKVTVTSTMKAKTGKSFPDMNKDGKVTKKDILMGRGVISKKKM